MTRRTSTLPETLRESTARHFEPEPCKPDGHILMKEPAPPNITSLAFNANVRLVTSQLNAFISTIPTTYPLKLETGLY